MNHLAGEFLTSFKVYTLLSKAVNEIKQVAALMNQSLCGIFWLLGIFVTVSLNTSQKNIKRVQSLSYYCTIVSRKDKSRGFVGVVTILE